MLNNPRSDRQPVGAVYQKHLEEGKAGIDPHIGQAIKKVYVVCTRSGNGARCDSLRF